MGRARTTVKKGVKTLLSARGRTRAEGISFGKVHVERPPGFDCREGEVQALGMKKLRGRRFQKRRGRRAWANPLMARNKRGEEEGKKHGKGYAEKEGGGATVLRQPVNNETTPWTKKNEGLGGGEVFKWEREGFSSPGSGQGLVLLWCPGRGGLEEAPKKEE